MIELLVVADDITGALDTGAQFARHGYRIYVSPLEHASALPAGGLDVLVVDTESRHLPPVQAAERVLRAVTAGGARVYYKKTDSTLRGNIGAELEAMLRASKRDAVAYLPSYPDAGRVVRQGVLRVDGIPLEETEYARDPLNPVRTSSIAKLIAEQTALPVRIATSSEAVESPLPRGSITVFDAESNAELERAAELLHAERGRAVFAGCAGFAGFLHRVLEPPSHGRIARATLSSSRRLIVCGSLNPRSRAQIEHAKAMGIPEYSIEALIAPPSGSRSRNRSRVRGEMLDELRAVTDERGTVALRTAPRVAEQGAAGTKAAREAGRAVAELMGIIDFDTLIVFGGDTLIAVMEEMGVVGLVPLDQIESGIPISLALMRPRDDGLRPTFAPVSREAGRRRPIVVSKAGGFGEAAVVETIETYLDQLAAGRGR